MVGDLHFVTRPQNGIVRYIGLRVLPVRETAVLKLYTTVLRTNKRITTDTVADPGRGSRGWSNKIDFFHQFSAKYIVN